MTTRTIRVWDLPTRLFHWLLVLAVAGAYTTAELRGEFFVWHGRFGLAILGLLVFRLVWGLIGPTYARFASFKPDAQAIRHYIDGVWHGAGHNPLGALSVFGMLLVLLLQAGTGLFASNQRAEFHGPLFDLVGKALSHDISGVHEFIFNFVMALVILHVAAIAWYVRVKKKNLVKPMLTGDAETDDDKLQATQGGGPLAFALALAVALGVVWLIGSGTLVAWLA
ncbi:MAG TPA: cytochrome b/b6 domain-containing protein [Parasulfuritortus sp.]